jgi:hypothetical protein
MDDLADSGTTCPVDIDAAVSAAGLDSTAARTKVDVSRGTGDGGRDASALDQVGGVYVECTRSVGGGDVTVVVFASDQLGAIGLLLPQIQHDLDLDVDALAAIVDRAREGDANDLIDLGAEGPATAARIDVDDAKSAVLYLSASIVPPASPEQTQTMAEKLLDDL